MIYRQQLRTSVSRSPARRPRRRRGVLRTGAFTLVELLITMAIIAIMATMVLVAMYAAQEQARAQKTRMLITKLNNIVMARYDEYRTRRVPIAYNTSINAAANARNRLNGLRDLMRLEMPDRWTDVFDAPVSGIPARPSVNQAYYSKYTSIAGAMFPPTVSNAAAIMTNQDAECLYMIVMEAVARDGDARDVFKADDIGDIDGDGFPEFHDAWGLPIHFIRWAPGFLSDLQSPLRGTGTIAQGASSKQYTVQITSNRFSQSGTDYIGGTIALIDSQNNVIDTRSLAKITGYQYAAGPPTTVTFICETPAKTDQLPFGTSMPTGSNKEIVILRPDPFDPRGVYPLYNAPGNGNNAPVPDTSVPTYALYPLILSSGPDRASGIKDENAIANPLPADDYLHYADTTKVGLNPFYVGPPVMGEPFALFLGGIVILGNEDGRWYKGCHLDNIHNHQLNSR